MKLFKVKMIVLLLAMFISQMACGQSSEISGTVSGNETEDVTITVAEVNESGADVASVIIPTSAVSGKVSGAIAEDVTITPAYAISGTVSGDYKEGVTITLSGDTSSTIKTDGAGTYRFTGLAKGDYKVTPTLTDSTFSPSRKSVTIAGDNITGVDFLCICDDEDNDDICD
jgi:hypothetical protein